MSDFILRTMTPADFAEVAELIYLSTNYWYVASGKGRIFTTKPSDCRVFCETYESLDPGCCLLVTDSATDRILGSCFYHPRPTHISVGIVNVHPNAFGQGIARRMLRAVIDIAQAQGKPVRLVSSAMNLDSFSLYTRSGFVPQMAFQDMVLSVPETGLAMPAPPGTDAVRSATGADIPAIVSLERECVGIEREKDYRFLLENAQGIWRLSVLEQGGELTGFLGSVTHPASHILGPGVARSEAASAALLFHELQLHRGRTPLFLIPVRAATLTAQCYAWGAKNCEIHFAQIHGHWQEPTGVLMPTFLPETG